MKVRTEEVVVPASTYTHTFLGCDHCDFETEDEVELKRHAATHAPAETKDIYGTKFYRFETEGNLKAFSEGANRGFRGDPTYGAWKGPGWYRETYESAPCGRGCCTREHYQLTHVQEFIRTELEAAREKFRDVRHLRKQLGLNA